MKTILVSYSQVKMQKRLLLILSACMLLLGIVTLFKALTDEEYMILFNLPLFGVLTYIFLKDIRRIKSISFDDEVVYISTDENAPITIIPLENIRSITIGQFDQSYRLHLVEPVNNEKHIYFKFPGFWMPFGPKLKPALILELRNKIDERKRLKDIDYAGETQILKMAEL